MNEKSTSIIEGKKSAARHEYYTENKLVTSHIDIAQNSYEFEQFWLFDYLLDLVYDSPMARICLNRIKAFLYAKGFADKDSADFKVNAKQTANQLLKRVIPYEGVFESYALVVKQNWPDMTVTEVICQPIEKVTKMLNGNYLVNPYRRNESGLYLQQLNVEYAPYEPDTKPTDFKAMLERQFAAHGKQIGRVVYIYDPEPGIGEHYAIPTYFAGDADLKTDAQYSRLDLFKVENDFQASIMIKTGKFGRTNRRDKQSGNEIPNSSDKAEFDRTMKRFTSKNPEERSSILHLEIEGNVKEMMPEVTTLNTNAGSVDLNARRHGIQSAVARNFSVPGVLVNLYQPGNIGDTKKIADEIALFNSVLDSRQERLTRGFSMIWPDMDWSISSLDPIQFIPEQVWQTMTTDEKREFAKLMPLPKKLTMRDRINLVPEAAKPQFIETLSEGEKREMGDLKTEEEDNIKETLNGEQITKLIELAVKVTAKEITPEAAIIIIKMAFGVSKLRAKQLVEAMLIPIEKEPEVIAPEAPVIPLAAKSS